MKALIVDDETHVIDAVRLLVPWESMGIGKVLSANSVVQAKEMILQEKPEIAIIDVMIGNETGIDLARFIAGQGDGIKIISISGHSDFDFVRGMFVYGCVDYLLKPIEEEQLIGALQKAVAAVQAEEKSKAIKRESHQHVEMLFSRHQQTLFLEMLQHGDTQSVYEELCHQNKAIAAAVQCQMFVCDLFFIPEKDTTFITSLRHITEEISNEMEKQNSGILLYRTQEVKELIIFLYNNFEATQRVLRRACIKLCNSFGPYLQFGCSLQVAFPGAVMQAYAQAQEAYLNADMCKRDLLLPYTSSAFHQEVPTNIQLENQLLSALLIGESALIETAVQNWMDFVWQPQPLMRGRVKSIWYYFNRLYERWIGYFYNRYTRFKCTDIIDDSFPFLQSPPAELNVHFQRFFCAKLSHIHGDICAARESRSRMYEVADYLEINYTRPFNQREYSEMLHINKEYLSRKFKETFHMGMVVYLTEIRIKHAKELLISSDLQIQEISNEVGFQDEGYFTKLFKKMTQMSPSAYRANKLNRMTQKETPL